MKIRTFLLTLFLLLIFGGGPLYCLRDEIEVPSFLECGKKIAPYSEWKQILVGKWIFDREWKSPIKGIWSFTGEIEYMEKDSFYSSMMVKHCSCNKIDDSDLDFYQGGSIAGGWGVDTIKGYWYDIFLECLLSSPTVHKYGLSEFNSCQEYFNHGNVWWTGNFRNSEAETKVIQFKNNKIVIKGHNFSTDSEMTITLNRKEE